MPKKEKRFSLPAIFYKAIGLGKWVQGSVTEESDGTLTAMTYVNARGQGDEAMKTVGAELKKLAKKAGKPIRHHADPANHGSVQLLNRTSGYKFVGYDENGKPIYEKIYKP